MPYEIKIEDDGAKIITRYFGLLTTADINAAYAERFTDVVKIKKCKVLLSDYSDVTETALDDVNVELLAATYKKASSFNPDVVSVAIMPGDLLYGLGRMWEGYVHGICWKEKIVRTRAQAKAFIEECNASG